MLRVKLLFYDIILLFYDEFIQSVPKLTLDILKADSLANLKTIFNLSENVAALIVFELQTIENKGFFAN